MLRSLSLRNKLLLAVGLPTFLLALITATSLRSSQEDARQSQEQAAQVDADLKALALALDIRAEQTAGLEGDQQELIATRESTDQSFAEAIESSIQHRSELGEMNARLLEIRTELGDDAASILLQNVRAQDPDPLTSSATLELQDDLTVLASEPLLLIEGSTASYTTGRVATQVSAVTALVRWESAILAEQGTVNIVFGPEPPTELQQLELLELAVEAETSQQAALAIGLEGFDLSDAVDQATIGSLYDYRTRLRESTQLNISPADRNRIASDADLLATEIENEVGILTEQIESENTQALNDANSSERNFLLAALIGIAAILVLLAVLYRSITNPIIELSTRGRTISNEELPNLVTRIRSGEAKAGEHEVVPLESQTDDEVGELTTVFNELHHTAASLAAEQAQSRQNAAEMFVNLGRRNQRVLDTVLRDLDVLERDERDPERLAQLYVVDQKVTRMRRNAESLLVLAGTQTPRQWAKPAKLGEVVRAAMSEVENFERVESVVDNTIDIPGNAVADITHLLAELIENSLRFSPPEESVDIRSEIVDGETHIYVTDHGFGIKGDKLAAANEQIAEAAHSQETPSKHLGLFVVGRLATRHGVDVTLVAAESGAGLTADVNLAGLTSTTVSSSSEPAEQQPGEDANQPVSEAASPNKPESEVPSPAEVAQMPQIPPSVPLSAEVSSHAERANQTEPVESKVATADHSTQDSPPEKPRSDKQRDFDEMTKPRAPKRRVPGASLPTNLKKPTTDTPREQPTPSQPQDIKDAFTSFQKSARTSNPTSAKTESNES